jgi:hypothetical protein
MDGIRGAGGKKVDESVKEIGIFIRPIAVGYGR